MPFLDETGLQRLWENILIEDAKYTTKEEFDNLKIGGRNLLLDSGREVTNNSYGVVTYTPIEPMKVGETYTLSICVTPGTGLTNLSSFVSQGMGGTTVYFPVSGTEKQVISKTFIMERYHPNYAPENNILNANIMFYRYPNDGTVTSDTTIHWAKLERGNKATDWSPAPEDIEKQITKTETEISNLSIGGRNLLTKRPTISSHLSTNITRMDYGFTIAPVNQDSFVNITTHEDIIQGEEYTLSMECEGFSEGEEWPFYVFNQWEMSFTLKNGKVSYTFRAPGNVGKNIVLDDQTRDKMPSGTITVKNLKLERGNKATDWTPAFEDFAPYAETVKTTSIAPSSKTKYYLAFSDNAATETDSLIKNSAINVNIQNGTTTAAGVAQLILGNGTATGTAGNMTGYITLYAGNGGDQRLEPNPEGSGTVNYLPKTGGTLVSGGNYTDVIPAATTSKAGLLSAADKQKLDELVSGGDSGESTITYVTAGKGLTGGGASGNVTLNIGAGSGISVADDSISVNTNYTTSGKNYKVQVDSTSGGLYVNVPWTDNNTTYSAGTGISISSGNAISNSGVRSISSGSTNGTISVNTGGTSAEVAVKGLGSAAYTSSGDYLKLSGGDMNAEATIKLTKYGTRFLTISGDTLYFDLSTTPGGWAVNLASVKDSKGDVIPLLGAYGTSDNGLTYMYMGDTAASPALKMTKAGVFTFKNTVEASITGSAGSAGVLSVGNCSNTDLNTLRGGSHRTYYGYTGMTNAPIQNIGVLEVIPYSGDWTVQRFTRINGENSAKEYTRHYYNGNTWSPWREYVTTGTNTTWAIDISGSAGSVAWGNVTSKTNATTSAAGLMSATDKAKLDGIAANANNYTYTLPTASSSTLGGVKIGAGIAISSGVISNSGVRSISTGSANGTISVNTNGSAADVAVKGLGTAAYVAASTFAPAEHTHSYLSTTGGALSGRAYYADNTTIETGLASLRNIKVVTTAITAGSTTIPTGEIWLKYE